MGSILIIERLCASRESFIHIMLCLVKLLFADAFDFDSNRPPDKRPVIPVVLRKH